MGPETIMLHDVVFKLIEVGQALVLPSALWVIKMCSQILSELKTLNGRVIKIEAWQTGHEDLDTQRFNSLERELSRIEVAVDSSRLSRAKRFKHNITDIKELKDA